MSATVRRYRPKPKNCAGRARRPAYMADIGRGTGGSFWCFECWVSRGNPAALRVVSKTTLRLEVMEEIKRFIRINQPPAALSVPREQPADWLDFTIYSTDDLIWIGRGIRISPPITWEQ